MPNPPVGTIYLLKRSELAVRSCMEVALADFDLTPAQFLLLFLLQDDDRQSAAALSRKIGVRPQSVTGIIAPLEQKGLLKREASPEHRRILHTKLTSAGRRLLGKALKVSGRIEAELLADLNDKEVRALQQSLAGLWNRAENHELHPGTIRARAEERMREHLAVRKRRGLRQTPPGRRTERTS